MKKYKLICKKGEGTFSEVVKAENVEKGKEYAIKCMKSTFDSLQQVNGLREIQALKRLSPHPNIIHLEEVLFDQPSGRLAMVFELMDANLYDLISGRRDHLDQEVVLSLGYQMFIALEHMHANGIFHRDIKPENILVDPTGKTLKLADLGSCRSINSNLPMTEYIATRWYRSPECLLTDGHYGVEMDIWGAGCVLFEIIALFPLFPGSDEIDQVNRIHKVVGTPEPEVLARLEKKGSSKINYKFANMKGIGIKHFIPHVTPTCVDLLTQTIIYDHTERMTATDAVNHEYFSTLRKIDNSKRSKKKKLSMRRHTRVESDKPSATAPVANKRQPFMKKAAISKLEKKKSADSSKSKSSTNFRNSKYSNKLTNGKSNIRTNNGKVVVIKTKKSSEKESNIKDISGTARRRRVAGDKTARLQKTKKETKNAKDLKLTVRRKPKFSNVQSSGYGRAAKPTQSKLTKKQSESKLNQNPLRSRIRRKDQLYDSAGTGSTGNTTLPPIKSANGQRISRLQKNKLSLKDQNKILPRIRV